MTQFRKKPVIIDALQWTGHNLQNVVQFAAGEGTYSVTMIDGLLLVATLEDGPNGEARHIATPGDWIIRGVKGEYYACKPHIFEATYEAVK